MSFNVGDTVQITDASSSQPEWNDVQGTVLPIEDVPHVVVTIMESSGLGVEMNTMTYIQPLADRPDGGIRHPFLWKTSGLVLITEPAPVKLSPRC